VNSTVGEQLTVVFGVVHKVCHAIFDQFWPILPLSHFVTNLRTP